MVYENCTFLFVLQTAHVHFGNDLEKATETTFFSSRSVDLHCMLVECCVTCGLQPTRVHVGAAILTRLEAKLVTK
jgi:hypothetical protein